ncbi:HpcH/HpaI aldolase/citrate lyase family protein [Nocardioides insulae]|uniref:HpcH/HpaI aldolase/citrate lyase family protein n=1 Tax=Nocardioides insulae TaxID=394734 RepID=UPI00041F82A4|nr:CoA ester lyase [Nocardioides insulae]
MSAALEVARTFLFVPGHRPDRFAKAAAAGADVMVIDLEDAVPAESKVQARADAVAWLAEHGSAGSVVVRINAVDTPWYADDVAALQGAAGISGLILPMAEPGEALTALGAGPLPVIALVETAVGVLDARAVAATPGVRRLALGSFDLASELGVDPVDQLALTATRSGLVLASAAAGLAGPIDGVRAGIQDEAGLREEAGLARRLGFTGKLCIHPVQVAPVAEVLAPSEAELDWARRIVAAVAEAGTDGVVKVDGQMVDKPVLDRAHHLLDAAPASL